MTAQERPSATAHETATIVRCVSAIRSVTGDRAVPLPSELREGHPVFDALLHWHRVERDVREANGSAERVRRHRAKRKKPA